MWPKAASIRPPHLGPLSEEPRPRICAPRRWSARPSMNHLGRRLCIAAVRGSADLRGGRGAILVNIVTISGIVKSASHWRLGAATELSRDFQSLRHPRLAQAVVEMLDIPRVIVG